MYLLQHNKKKKKKIEKSIQKKKFNFFHSSIWLIGIKRIDPRPYSIR